MLAAADTATGEITSPEPDAVVLGSVDLAATYDDGDEFDNDSVYWAVRLGTCDASTNTVAGNVDGFNDAYDWDTMNFSATVDTTGWTPGEYCFVYNPNAGGDNVRETRWFVVPESYVTAGGHILEEEGEKRKDWYDVSASGWTADIGSLVGEWQVNFHNTSDDAVDKTKFHGSDIIEFNLYAPDSLTCTGAMNVAVSGRYEGVDGYHMIIRAGDDADTMRFELYDPLYELVYDTHTGDFADESSCKGTARTGLDTGDLMISM